MEISEFTEEQYKAVQAIFPGCAVDAFATPHGLQINVWDGPRFGIDWTCDAHGATCPKHGLDLDC